MISKKDRTAPKKGDLVNFYTSNPSWIKEYKKRNPGVVVSCRSPQPEKCYDKGGAEILWADGSITREHMTYLEVIK